MAVWGGFRCSHVEVLHFEGVDLTSHKDGVRFRAGKAEKDNPRVVRYAASYKFLTDRVSEEEYREMMKGQREFRLIPDGFDSVGKDEDELVFGQQRLDPRPSFGKKGLESGATKISETEVHHPRWRGCQHCAVAEVGVLTNDHKLPLSRVFPQVAIGGTWCERSGMNRRK